MNFDLRNFRTKIYNLTHNDTNSDNTSTSDDSQVPNNAILLRESDNIILINGIPANIESYEPASSDLSVKVKFKDGGYESAKVNHSVNDAIRICIAKHVGEKYYNAAGIRHLAERLSYLKCIDKMLDEVHSDHQKENEAMTQTARHNSTRSHLKIRKHPHRPSKD